jgi:hypothetical protein
MKGKFPMEMWNHFENYQDRTNNCVEGIFENFFKNKIN